MQVDEPTEPRERGQDQHPGNQLQADGEYQQVSQKDRGQEERDKSRDRENSPQYIGLYSINMFMIFWKKMLVYAISCSQCTDIN